MAKTRTLPDKYYDKDYETNGIHRVPLWRIAGFALNNTATNLYLMFMNYVSFYLLGFVGVGMVMASSFTMAMRIWDGVTDPFIGYMVDKTNGKFGKNRPFMVIGNIILAASSFIMFHFTHKLPEGPARFIFFVVFCCIYYLGYTCQCVVTKSAQSCMTNDPKQRPMFASFDGVFNTILFTVLAIVVANIANRDRRHLHCTQRPPGILWHWQTHQGRPERLLGYPEKQPRHPDAGAVRLHG